MPDGTFDSSFGDYGKVIYSVNQESYAYECIIKSNGKILIAGAAANPSYEFAVLLMRLNEDGSLDESFGTGGIVQANISSGDDFAYSMIELPNHKIVIAGSLSNSLNQAIPAVVQFNENGTVDTNFGTNGVAQIPVISSDNKFRRIAAAPNNQIMVCGHYDMGLTFEGSINFDILVAKLNENGTFDNSFGTNGVVKTALNTGTIDDAFGLEVLADGSTLVCGFTAQPNYDNDMVLLKYSADGTLDGTFGTEGVVTFNPSTYDVGYDIEMQSDNKILLCGSIANASSGDIDFIVARFTEDGIADYPFGTYGYTASHIGPGQDDANAMALQADGKIVVAGKIMAANNNDLIVARYLAEDITAVNEITTLSNYSIFPNPAHAGQNNQIARHENAAPITTLEIIDLTGKLITSQKPINSVQTQLSGIEVPSNLPAGLYMLKIRNEQFKTECFKIQVSN